MTLPSGRLTWLVALLAAVGGTGCRNCPDQVPILTPWDGGAATLLPDGGLACAAVCPPHLLGTAGCAFLDAGSVLECDYLFACQ